METNWTFEELDLEGAHEELSIRIVELGAVRDFIVEKLTKNDDAKIRNFLWESEDESRVEFKTLMAVRKSLRKIRYWDVEDRV